MLLVFLMVQTFALGRAEKGGKCLNRNTRGRTLFQTEALPWMVASLIQTLLISRSN